MRCSTTRCGLREPEQQQESKPCLGSNEPARTCTDGLQRLAQSLATLQGPGLCPITVAADAGSAHSMHAVAALGESWHSCDLHLSNHGLRFTGSLRWCQ